MGCSPEANGLETVTDNCFGLAAQLAYYFFLSVFPALLVVVALTSVFPRNLLDQILAWFGSFTPPDVLQIVRAQIQLFTKSGHTGLLTFGVLGALWSSSSAMNATIDTLNRAVRNQRGATLVESAIPCDRCHDHHEPVRPGGVHSCGSRA